MRKLGFMFPGQGSQYVRMGKALYDESKVAREVFKIANEALGLDIAKLCFEGDIEQLTKTENAQPAILTASVAAYRTYLDRNGIIPICAAGHSLGEYTALTASGAIELSDAVKIVRKRGIFMQEAALAGEGLMAAVGDVDIAVIEKECIAESTTDNIVVISNYNSSNQTVISGHKNAVEKVGHKLEGMGARVTYLKVSAAFHSPIMQQAADKLKDELLKYKFNPLKFPVISNVSAAPYEGVEQIVSNLTKQLVQPVQWTKTMDYFVKKGINIGVEMGPQNVLRNIVRKTVPSIKAFSYDNSEDIEALKEELKPKANEPTVVTRSMAVAVCTRNFNWNNDEYQAGVSIPYKKIEQMQEEIEKSGQYPTVAQMEAALEMLKSVFETKRTPVEEQIERFEQIFNETGTRHLFENFVMPSEEKEYLISNN